MLASQRENEISFFLIVPNLYPFAQLLPNTGFIVVGWLGRISHDLPLSPPH